MYRVPAEFLFPIHHVRPRFKSDVENVLLYVAGICAGIAPTTVEDYNEQLFNAIKLYPGNESSADKTINNWRTEIAALFGFYIEDKKGNETRTGETAKLLSLAEDLVQFFKYFLLKFQYPGGHIKSNYVKEIIQHGISFKPAKYILSLLHQADEYLGKPLGISKAEATHCIFNDLRVTRDSRSVREVIDLITANRTGKIDYDSRGDVVRYAGDILDYMVLANLLKESHGYYYLNRRENESILAIMNNSEYFAEYDRLYNKSFSTAELTDLETEWFEYVNSGLNEQLFKTDILSYIAEQPNEQGLLIEEIAEAPEQTDGYRVLVEDKIAEVLGSIKTKEIGDLGEMLVIGHEKTRLRDAGRSDLLHLIKKIPTSLAVGYDIQSAEINSIKRFIEVKTTVSSKPLHFYSFHLTPNEWDAASSLKDRYFVYRLMISKKDKTILILQDPVGMYKKDQINMSPRNGAEITFPEDVCEKTDLMIWQD